MKQLAISIADIIILIGVAIVSLSAFKVYGLTGLVIAVIVSALVTCVWCALSVTALELIKIRKILEKGQ